MDERLAYENCTNEHGNFTPENITGVYGAVKACRMMHFMIGALAEDMVKLEPFRLGTKSQYIALAAREYRDYLDAADLRLLEGLDQSVTSLDQGASVDELEDDERLAEELEAEGVGPVRTTDVLERRIQRLEADVATLLLIQGAAP